MDVKNAVAENIPAFCKKRRRLVSGMIISFHKSSEKLQAASHELQAASYETHGINGSSPPWRGELRAL